MKADIEHDHKTVKEIQPDGKPGRDAVPDPFDPDRLRLSQNFAAASGVKRMITTIPVRKPSKEVFVQTHPDDTYRIHTAILELKEDREVYLVSPELLGALAGESTVSPRLLVTAVTRQGAPFLWPLRLPGQDGRLDDWGRSALEAAEAARGKWVRIQSNMSAGCYDVFVAENCPATPEWPSLQFSELLRIAFKDKYIDSLDHPVLKKLRGEI